MKFKLKSSLLITTAFLLLVPLGSVGAQTVSPLTVNLNVDATEAPRKIFHASMTMPVSPGPLTLVYPEWIPGEHGPTGPIINLAGLKFVAGGKTISWRRDDVDFDDVVSTLNSIAPFDWRIFLSSD